MVKSMFAGVAGLKAHQQKMDVIGNNIANVNTWGYKAYSFNFTDSIYTTSIQSSGGSNEANRYGGRNPSQVGYGAVMGSISFQYTAGAPSPTDNDLDCMIDGTGLFLVGDMKATGVPANNEGIRGSGLSLSRVGIFTIDNNGYLVDAQGNYVYGYEVTKNAEGKVLFYKDDADTTGTPDPKGGTARVDINKDLRPLQIPCDQEDTTGTTVNGVTTYDRHVMNSYTIDAQGVVTGVNKRGETITLGRLALIAVENPNGMVKDTGYYFKLGDNAGEATAHAPGGTVGTIRSKYLEMPNVDLANEFSSMITTQRGFQANSKIITVTDEMLQELVNMKR